MAQISKEVQLPEPLRVVCLGGGYVANFLCRAARPAIEAGRLDVTVISRDNFQTFHGLAAEVLSGKIQPSAIVSPVRRIIAPARFYNGEIETIDLARQVVTTTRALDGREHEVCYDHLVFGVGAMDDIRHIPGVADHALKLKTYADLLKTRSHFLTMLELAEIEPDAEERRRLLTYVIAGGNYAGVEVATELTDYIHCLIKREYQRIVPAEVRVLIVHAGDSILPELRLHHPRLASYAAKQLQQQAQFGLEVRLGVRLIEATSGEAILSSGERIPTRTIVGCVGTVQSPLLDNLPFARDERGRLLTDRYCRVLGTDNIWAGGDSGAIPHPRGGVTPMLAIYAMNGGKQIGKNLSALSAGKPLRPFRFSGLGDAVALSRARAAGHLWDVIPLTGLPAWLLWRAIMLMYLPTRDRKIRTLFDWLVVPWLGRDIVNIPLESHGEVRRVTREAGHVIVKQGDLDHELYVIQSGQVEIIRETARNVGRASTLGPGEHFGEREGPHHVRRGLTVIAKTRVELLVLRTASSHPDDMHTIPESRTVHPE